MKTLDRRTFIGHSLLLPAMGGSLASTALGHSIAGGEPRDAALVMYRADIPYCADFAAGLQIEGIQILALETDIVRQWRTLLGTGALSGHTVLLGMGNWDDYFLVRELAAELRLKPLQLLQHSPQGQAAALYSWSIG